MTIVPLGCITTIRVFSLRWKVGIARARSWLTNPTDAKRDLESPKCRLLKQQALIFPLRAASVLRHTRPSVFERLLLMESLISISLVSGAVGEATSQARFFKRSNLGLLGNSLAGIVGGRCWRANFWACSVRVVLTDRRCSCSGGRWRPRSFWSLLAQSRVCWRSRGFLGPIAPLGDLVIRTHCPGDREICQHDPKTLVSTDWLAGRIWLTRTWHFWCLGWYLPAMRTRRCGRYQAAPIPGARYFDIDEIQRSPVRSCRIWPRRSQKFISRMRKMGHRRRPSGCGL